MSSRALVDTGALYAMADEDDAWHARVRDCLQTLRDTLIVPVTVLPEACYLLSKYLGPRAELALLFAVRNGELKLEGLGSEDLGRCTVLMEKYLDAGLGFVDATLVAVAERLKIRRVLTTDRRHFTLVRPLHCPRFDLLP